MVDVQQFLTSIFRRLDVAPAINRPVAGPDTRCPEPLNLGTSHVNPLVMKGVATLTVNVHSCIGKMLSLELGPSTTVEELKTEIQRQTGYPAKSIDLFYNSQTLDNGFDLGRLKANDSLVVVHKVHGG